MTELGMPTLIETETPEECAKLCSELGLRFIELNMNLPQYQSGQMDTHHFMDLAEKYGIYYTIHLDENLNVSDFNPHVADAYRQTVRETIELAKKLHVPVLNMHMSHGVYFTLPSGKVYLFDVYAQRYLESIRVFRDECEKCIGDCDIKICIENSSGYTQIQKTAIELMLDSPVFGLTFDVGHNNGTGGADEPFILERSDRLCHMHLHDSLGKKDHLVLGEGELDLKRYLSLAQDRRCRVVLETKTVEGLRRSVEWMEKNS